MLDRSHYFRAGDVTHCIEVKAAPPGDSIRYADEIRKEIAARADKAFRERLSVEFESPELGRIRLVFAHQVDPLRMERMVYFKLNGHEHRISVDIEKYRTRDELIQWVVDKLSECIARSLLSSFAREHQDRLFGGVR